MKIDVSKYLLEHGVKPSVQRLAIMDYLLNHFTHPTADEIFNALHPAMPTLSKTTVYNTLNLFAEQGVVVSLDIDPRETHYDGDITAHAHFFCEECGRIYDLPMPELKGAMNDQFQVSEIKVYYKGVCAECRHQSTAKNKREEAIN